MIGFVRIRLECGFKIEYYLKEEANNPLHSRVHCCQAFYQEEGQNLSAETVPLFILELGLLQAK